jgi:thiamine-monophosphate kinase
MNEFELIDHFFKQPAYRASLGIGDDAAVFKPSPGHEMVVTVDAFFESSHFLPHTDAKAVGHKALAVNLSDLAAMGATPRYVLLALVLPQVDETWLKGFADGLFALASRFAVELIGGDTIRGPLGVCITAMGEVPEKKALLRQGAKVGDEIWVSGTLGDARLALAHRRGEMKLSPEWAIVCQQKIDYPEPRVLLGQNLLDVAHAAIDISDGFLADLHHILKASGVGATIDLARVPQSEALKAYPDWFEKAALSGGDDYELLFTAPLQQHRAIEQLATDLGLRLTAVGQIIPQGVFFLHAPPGFVPSRGFDHFAQSS